MRAEDMGRMELFRFYRLLLGTWNDPAGRAIFLWDLWRSVLGSRGFGGEEEEYLIVGVRGILIKR